MADDQHKDAPMMDNTRAPSPSMGRGRRIERFVALAALAGCAFLGVLLNQGHEREAALQIAWSTSEDQRAEAERRLERSLTELASVTGERDDLQSMLQQTERARATSERALSAARAEFSDCSNALQQAVSLARGHRDKLDEIARAIRIGMIGIADVPAEGFVGRAAFDLQDEYRLLVRRYNDLVDRFNASIERSNDLGDILNTVIRIVRQ